MKARHSLIAAVCATLFFAGAAQARDYSDRYDRYDRYERDRSAHYERDRYHRDHARLAPVKLRLDVYSNGHARVPLKRMLREQYGINPNDYRIRSVAIRNKNRHNACADLKIGHRSTGPVFLRRGVTHIKAPGGRRAAEGRWVLNLDAARVRGVSVVLEPKRGYANYRHGYSRDRFLAKTWY